MSKLSVFNFSNEPAIISQVDKFAPPDATGQLKILRKYLIETLPDRQHVTAVEASELVLPAMYAAGLVPDEVEAAFKVLFISNAYFLDMMLGIAKSEVRSNPNVRAGRVENESGQSVVVADMEYAGEGFEEETVLPFAVREPVEINEDIAVLDESIPFVGENPYFTAEDKALFEDEANAVAAVVGIDPAMIDSDQTVFTEVSMAETPEEQDAYRVIQKSNDDEVADEAAAEVTDEIVEDVMDFSEMKVPELRAYAESKNIDLGKRTKKLEIVAHLIEVTQSRGEYKS